MVKIMPNKMKIYVIVGGTGHWSRTYYTPKHLNELYQESLKKKNIKTYFAYEDNDSDYRHLDATNLDISDLFSKPNGSIDHLIGNGSVRKYIFLYYVLNFKKMLYIYFMLLIYNFFLINKII